MIPKKYQLNHTIIKYSALDKNQSGETLFIGINYQNYLYSSKLHHIVVNAMNRRQQLSLVLDIPRNPKMFKKQKKELFRNSSFATILQYYGTHTVFLYLCEKLVFSSFNCGRSFLLPVVMTLRMPSDLFMMLLPEQRPAPPICDL